MRRLLGTTGVIVVGLAIAWFALIRFPRPARPALGGTLVRGSLAVDGRARTFVYYLPATLPAAPAVVLALHGSGESGEQFRWHSGYAFDRAADAGGFIVVYPDGYQHHWDDCRKAAHFAARTLRIDDVAFVRAIVTELAAKLSIDRRRVFAAGHSNGGQMAYRLALEMPDEIRAVAAISASLPTTENLDCTPSGKPVPALVMNGTDDPLNPYWGGRVSIFGFGDRGDVRSSEETARYFAGLAGVVGPPEVRRVPGADASFWVERASWGPAASPAAVLDTIHGGGHVVPQDVARYPRILGRTDTAFDGPAEIWRFFAAQPPR
jgi:polyhydroxybutyrate depolymerase